MKPEFMRKMRFSFFQKRKSNFPSTEETNKTQFLYHSYFRLSNAEMEQKSEKKEILGHDFGLSNSVLSQMGNGKKEKG